MIPIALQFGSSRGSRSRRSDGVGGALKPTTLWLTRGVL